MEEYKKHGIPWDASSFVLQEARYHYLLSSAADFAACERKYTFNSWQAPTVREMKWRWKIRQAAPEIEAEVGCRADVRHLASKFVYREMLRDLYGQPAEFDDLEAALAMKPWLDEQHHQEYHLAVERGVIPPNRQEKHADEIAAAAIDVVASVQEGKVCFLLGAGAVEKCQFTSEASRSQSRAMEKPKVGQEPSEVTLDIADILGITPDIVSQAIHAAGSHSFRDLVMNYDHPELLFSQQLQRSMAVTVPSPLH